jgi:hypothetical protein
VVSRFWRLRLSTLAWGFAISYAFTGSLVVRAASAAGRAAGSAGALACVSATGRVLSAGCMTSAELLQPGGAGAAGAEGGVPSA